MERVQEAEQQFGVTIGALEAKPAEELSDKTKRYLARLEQARGPLTAGLPDDGSQDDLEQRARRLTFDLLGYHRREAKPAWWEYYRRGEMTPGGLRDYDSEAIGDLTPVPHVLVEQVNKSYVFTLEFPQQELKLGEGGAVDDQEQGVTIVDLEEQARIVRVRRGKARGLQPPRALVPGTPFATDAQIDSLFRFAD